jgi:shikimate dehydrogenase
MKKLAAVIGDPVDHSLSPKLHNYLLKKYNINGVYTAIKVEKHNLVESIKSIVDDGYAGFNVTIPHKEKMFEICDEKTEIAIATKAVNTVIITKDKKLIGDNSDGYGFLQNLKNTFPNFDLKNKTAFIIGAGGASRAIIYALIASNVSKIYITNRSEYKALKIIEDYYLLTKNNNIQLQLLEFNNFIKTIGICDILINTTSSGMNNQNILDVNLDFLDKNAIVCDIVYKPLMTGLLTTAQNRGNRILTGIGMLIYQGFIGFEKWFGAKPELDDELVDLLSKKSFHL